MNDLPQNELLSAYLDGELTAAEQAEVERLLAASPAARQLLDELRALSAAIQALPRQELDEDLGPQVLRVAERRMLTEEVPGQETPAAPLGRSIFDRFVNRRTLVWLALTAVVAVAILIDERRHHVQPALEAAREVAKAPAEAAKRASGLREPPSMRAANDEDFGGATERRSLAKRKSAPAAAEKPADRIVDKLVAEKPLGQGAGAESAPRKDAPAAAVPPAMPAAPSPEPVRVAAKSGPLPANGGVVHDKKAGAELGYGKRSGDADHGIVRNAPTEAGRAGQEYAEDAVEPERGVLVIHCDISSEAAKKQAFQKLLDANGIAWRSQQGQIRFGGAEQEAATVNAKREKSQSKASGRTTAAKVCDTIDAHATPAQIEATLAGLAAQPEMFLSYSVAPPLAASLWAENRQAPLSGPAQNLFRRQIQTRNSVAYRGAQNKAPAGGLDANVPQAVQADRRQNVQQANNQQQLRQQVLFVLHVLGDHHPAAAIRGDAAQPAEKPAKGGTP
jgi:hypothetical protein